MHVARTYLAGKEQRFFLCAECCIFSLKMLHNSFNIKCRMQEINRKVNKHAAQLHSLSPLCPVRVYPNWMSGPRRVVRQHRVAFQQFSLCHQFRLIFRCCNSLTHSVRPIFRILSDHNWKGYAPRFATKRQNENCCTSALIHMAVDTGARPHKSLRRQTSPQLRQFGRLRA